MHIVNIHEAKTNLSKLIEKTQKGEEVIIGKAGKPVANFLPIKKLCFLTEINCLFLKPEDSKVERFTYEFSFLQRICHSECNEESSDLINHLKLEDCHAPASNAVRSQ